MEGGTSIKLSELIDILGITKDVKSYTSGLQLVQDIQEVSFSDETLLKIIPSEKVLGIFGTKDWTLQSLQPFSTDETLNILMNDGTSIVINVTDDVAGATTNLNQLNPSVKVSGADLNPDGSYSVKPGKDYSIQMTFQETNGGVQFSDDNEMVFTLPEGITLKDVNATFSIPVNDAGTHVTINGNTARVDGNKLYIKLNKDGSNPEDYQRLQNVTTASITVNAKVNFESKEGETEYEFPGGGTYKVDNNPDVDIIKTAQLVNFDTGEVEYTLTLTSNGNNNGVTVTDTITGDAITLNSQTIALKDASGNTVKTTTTSSNKEFTLVTGPLKNGTYTIKYKATLDKSKLHEDPYYNGALGTASDTENKVKWDGDKETSTNIKHIVTKPKSSKHAGNTITDSNGKATSQWTINAESNYLEKWRLKEISDSIKSDGVTYSGRGITVKIFDQKTGNQVGTDQLIEWEDIGVNSSSTSWTIPDISVALGNGYNNVGKYWRYELSYTTEYNASSLDEPIQIKNEEVTNNDPDPHEAIGTVQPTPDNRSGINKSSKKVTDKEIVWRIELTIPKNGVKAGKAFVTEELPHQGTYRDSYKEESFHFVENESTFMNDREKNPTITPNDNGTVTISWPEGFAISDSQRKIVFEFTTTNDPNWVNDSTVNARHQNHAIFNGNHSWADGEPVLPMFIKTGSTYREQDGEFYYDFDVKTNKIVDDTFSGDSPLTFTDTFDSRLEYVSGSAKIYAGNKKDDINISQQNTNISEPQVDGNTLTFNVTKNQLPKNDGALYPFYRIHYTMRVKDKDALIAAALSSTGFTVKMGNKIDSVIGDDDTTVEYTPEVLDKRKLAEENGRIKFEIKVNEIKQDLSPSGDVLVLTDTLTNLSAHYQDIQIVVHDYDSSNPIMGKDEAGNDVDLPYFNMQGDTITFYLPDNYATTITYWSKAVGEASADGQIHYSNTAKLNGYEKTVSDKINYYGDASGTATNYGVKLYKADGYVNSNMLAGAKFKLYVADEEDQDGNIISGTPMKDQNGNDLIIESSSEGVVEVKGNAELGWNLRPEQRYYLLEVEAPPNCAIDNTKYSFLISPKGYVNYSRNAIQAPDGSGAIIQPWTFYNGDVLTVKNWPKLGELDIKKSFDGVNASDLDDDQKAAIKFEVYKLNSDGTSYSKIKIIGYDEFTSDTYKVSDLEPGTYKVVEIVSDQNCKETTYRITSQASSSDQVVKEDGKDSYATIVVSEQDIRDKTTHSVEITNKYNIPSEFKIYKYADLVAGQTDVKLSGAEFGVFTVVNGSSTNTQVGENYVTNSRGRLTIVPGENGIEYDTLYAVKEVVPPKGFKLSNTEKYFYFRGENSGQLADTPSGTIEVPYHTSHEEKISNSPGTTKIGVDKIWQNELLEVEENNATPIQVKIVQTATYDKAGKIVEQSESGYFPDMVLNVKKEEGVWKLSVPEGKTLPEGLSIDGTTGELKGLPTMKVLQNGAPLYYTYTVEEQPVNGYKPSYEYVQNEDGSISATIINRPSNINSFVSLKAQKRWLDANGNDITSEMGYNDSVNVDVYRVNHLVKEGIIKDGDGTQRDPSQLFPVVFVEGNGSSGAHPEFSQTLISCLPGDEIEVKVTARIGRDLTTNDINVQTSYLKPDGNYEGNNDLSGTLNQAEKQITYTFNADASKNAVRITSKHVDVKKLTVEVINKSAEGRTQILSQLEADSVGGEKVETLELSKANGWKASSKEYSAGSGSTVYAYYLVEQNGSNFNAKYTVQGDNIIVSNTDKRLRVDKKWFRPDGETKLKKDDGEITYNLYQVARTVKWVETGDNIYTGTGELKIDLSELQFVDSAGNPKNITLTGNYSEFNRIKAGSKIKVEITTDKTGSEELNERFVWNGSSNVSSFNVTGGTLESNERKDIGSQNYKRTLVISDATSNIKLKGGLISADNATITVNVTVLGEFHDGDEPSDADLTKNRIGQITMTKDDTNIIFDEAFGESDIKVKPGTDSWTSIVSNLPAKGKNGESYTYYITEESITGFEQMEITPNNVSNGGTVVIKNKAEAGKVKVTKAFKGINNLPANFKITATYGDEELVLTTSDNQPKNVTLEGSGSEEDPYEWTLDKIAVGTNVSFTETGILVDGKILKVNGTATVADAATVTAKAVTSKNDNEPTADNGGVASLVNEYGNEKGSLKVKKLVKVNGVDPTTDTQKLLTNGTYTFSIKKADSDEILHTVEIAYEGGSVQSASLDNNSIELQDGFVVVPDLDVGEYIIEEAIPENGMTLSDISGGQGDGNISRRQITVEVKAGEEISEEASATFTNNKQTKEYEFSKIWKKSDDTNESTWPDGKMITIEVTRKISDNGSSDPNWKYTYTITKDYLEDGKTIASKEEHGPSLEVVDAAAFKFKLSGLAYSGTIGSDTGEFIYCAIETPKVDGCKDPLYKLGNVEKDAAYNGGSIINRPEDAVTLPHTGGIGTDLFRTLGLLLITFAVMGYGYKLAMRKRLVLRTGKDPKGGDSRR